MTAQVNLLPGAYRQARRRRSRTRIVFAVGACLLMAELGGAMLLHWRARDTRSLHQAAAGDRAAVQSLKKEIERPAQEAEIARTQVALAQRLRTKHRWSRLLGTIAQATPENVVLSTVASEPAQWTSSLRTPGGTNALPRVLDGITLTGHAADHADLAMFVASLHRAKTFATLELRQARREKYMGQDAILFELSCQW